MTIKITRKIKGYSVKQPGQDKAAPAPSTPADTQAEVIQMHEKLERPGALVGVTYKIKSPLFEHALYVTINDIVLNAGTAHESRRPFEIFINSKNMDHFQWIVALTRIMSAVFRKGGDVTFLVEELKAVFDPRGGYFKPGGIYMPSIVAELGLVIEQHLKSIGLIKDTELSPEQQALIAEKRSAYAATQPAPAASDSEASNYPPGATMCHKCNTNAVVLMDGCATCLACGYSKCG